MFTSIGKGSIVFEAVGILLKVRKSVRAYSREELAEKRLKEYAVVRHPLSLPAIDCYLTEPIEVWKFLVDFARRPSPTFSLSSSSYRSFARPCSGIQRVWSRHTDDFARPQPPLFVPFENDSFLSRHDDVRVDRNAEYIVDQIGEMEFPVDENRETRHDFCESDLVTEGYTTRFAFASGFSGKERSLG